MTGQEPSDALIVSFEFDTRNLTHMAVHGIDDNLVVEVLAGEPVFAQNPPAPDRSGSDLMIGPSATGRWWTIVILLVDDDADIWRPITGWPSTSREQQLWREEISQRPRSES
jgi:hypothetical protein